MKVKQFRWYDTDNVNNYPELITKDSLINGSIFDSYCPIRQLGIQALPGTEFYLNKSEDSVIIGVSGMYELNLDTQISISSLQFRSESLNSIENSDTGLIIDILYEGGDE